MRTIIVNSAKALYWTWWRRRTRPRIANIPVDRLLQGGERLIDGARYARLVEDPSRTSRAISEWPHTRLLAAFLKEGEAILSPETLPRTPYWGNACQCLAHTGRYFSAKDEAGIYDVARRFLRRAFPERFPPDAENLAPHEEHHSPAGSLPIVFPVFSSPYFQILDGHHRAAIASIRGEALIKARVQHWPVKTRLQEMVLDVVWQQDRAELYQPAPFPEFAGWPLVRRCEDRLALMTAKLAELGVSPARHRYLDVGSSYGWFVARMSRLGYQACGVELDRFAALLARPLYGAPEGCITQSEAVRFLQSSGEIHDIVSCFSVLHHFVLGKGSVDAAAFIRLLERATGKVLFIDTGEAHECWFRESLREWTPDFIEQWLRRHTGFRQIVRLGRDKDNVPPFADAYGRTLFACIR